jgi:hypothetical protein
VLQVNENTLKIISGNSSTLFEVHNEMAKPQRDFLFYRIDGQRIYGETLEGSNERRVLWEIQIPAGEEIVSIKSSFRNDQLSRLPLYDDKKVYFKNIDFTNFAIVTKSQNTSKLFIDSALNLCIVNAGNGHILFNKFRKNIDFGNYVNLAYDENTVFVTYFSRMNKLF